MLIAALLAVAGPLDAPIDTHPTVRSEIRRGAAAAPDCDRGDNALDTIAVSMCLFDASSANQQKMSQGYEPFEIGLYYEGAELLKITAGVTHKQADAEHAAQDHDVYVHLRDKLKLTDADVVAAARGD